MEALSGSLRNNQSANAIAEFYPLWRQFGSPHIGRLVFERAVDPDRRCTRWAAINSRFGDMCLASRGSTSLGNNTERSLYCLAVRLRQTVDSPTAYLNELHPAVDDIHPPEMRALSGLCAEQQSARSMRGLAVLVKRMRIDLSYAWSDNTQQRVAWLGRWEQVVVDLETLTGDQSSEDDNWTGNFVTQKNVAAGMDFSYLMHEGDLTLPFPGTLDIPMLGGGLVVKGNIDIRAQGPIVLPDNWGQGLTVLGRVRIVRHMNPIDLGSGFGGGMHCKALHINGNPELKSLRLGSGLVVLGPLSVDNPNLSYLAGLHDAVITGKLTLFSSTDMNISVDFCKGSDVQSVLMDVRRAGLFKPPLFPELINAAPLGPPVSRMQLKGELTLGSTLSDQMSELDKAAWFQVSPNVFSLCALRQPVPAGTIEMTDATVKRASLAINRQVWVCWPPTGEWHDAVITDKYNDILIVRYEDDTTENIQPEDTHRVRVEM